MGLAGDCELDDREERWAVDRVVAEGDEVASKKAMNWTSESYISLGRPKWCRAAVASTFGR
jgi:hypothetical protein